MPVCGLYIYVCVCVYVCRGRYAKRAENSEYYVPFLKIHNTNQQIEGPDKFCGAIPVGPQLQLTKNAYDLYGTWMMHFTSARPGCVPYLINCFLTLGIHYFFFPWLSYSGQKLMIFSILQMNLYMFKAGKKVTHTDVTREFPLKFDGEGDKARKNAYITKFFFSRKNKTTFSNPGHDHLESPLNSVMYNIPKEILLYMHT